VLIVDDDRDTADGLACSWLTGARGPKSQRRHHAGKTARQTPDVVLLDVGMPHIKVRVGNSLRRDDHRTCFLIAITGFADGPIASDAATPESTCS
jgi:FixJ family two-component response regulator